MSARAVERVAILLLLVVSTACSETSDSSASVDGAGNENHFAAYARTLFAELRREPLDSKAQIEVGLFGNPSLSTDEQVVMRRFRYNVDRAEYGPVAQMAFQVRDSLQREGPVPILLTFAFRESAWRLEPADYGADARGSAAEGHGDHQAADPPALDSLSDPVDPEAGMAPLQRRLRSDFHESIDSPIQRTNTSPITASPEAWPAPAAPISGQPAGSLASPFT